MRNRFWLSVLLGCFCLNAAAQVELPDKYKNYCTPQSNSNADVDFTQPPLKDYCNQLKENSDLEYTKFVEGFLNDTKVSTKYSNGNSGSGVAPFSGPTLQSNAPTEAPPAPPPPPASEPQQGGSPITY